MNGFWFNLCESFAPSELARVDAQQRTEVVGAVTTFVTEQLACLPILLQFGLALGLFVFRVFVWVTQKRPFGSLDLESRRKLSESWAFGKVALARQLFRPIGSLAIFAYYENPVVLRALANSNLHSRVPETKGDNIQRQQQAKASST